MSDFSNSGGDMGTDRIRDGRMSARPSARQVGGGILVIVLLVFIFTNTDDVRVSLLGVTVDTSLWIVLMATAAIGFGIGYLVSSRRSRARRRD